MKTNNVEAPGQRIKTVEITIEDAVCGVCQGILEDGGEGTCSCQLVDDGEEEELQ